MTARAEESRCPGCGFVAGRLGRVYRATSSFLSVPGYFFVANPHKDDTERLSATADAAVTGVLTVFRITSPG
jgi:hypothetical protein